MKNSKKAVTIGPSHTVVQLLCEGWHRMVDDIHGVCSINSAIVDLENLTTAYSEQTSKTGIFKKTNDCTAL